MVCYAGIPWDEKKIKKCFRNLTYREWWLVRAKWQADTRLGKEWRKGISASVKKRHQCEEKASEWEKTGVIGRPGGQIPVASNTTSTSFENTNRLSTIPNIQLKGNHSPVKLWITSTIYWITVFRLISWHACPQPNNRSHLWGQE